MSVPARGPWLGALAIVGVFAILLLPKKAAADAGPLWEPMLAQLEAYEFARTGQRILTQRIREALAKNDLEGARIRLAEYNKALANWADPNFITLAEQVRATIDAAMAQGIAWPNYKATQ